MNRAPALLLAGLLALPACSDPATEADAGDPFDAGPCEARQLPNQGWTHVAEGSAIDYEHNPPTSGPHYPIWASYTVHDEAFDRGYWVHNLEHGGVVLVYRPEAPQEQIDGLLDAYAAIPNDPACGHRRTLVVPDPDLDDTVAIVAADWVIEGGDCVSNAIVLDFVAEHRGEGPENVCADGSGP